MATIGTYDDTTAAPTNDKRSLKIMTLTVLQDLDGKLSAAATTATPPAPAGLLNGRDAAARNAAYIGLAWRCYDLGSSRLVVHEGNLPTAGTNRAISWTQLIDAILGNGLTLRQFCAAFASILYDQAKVRGRYPANWSDKGYTEASRGAAFDFSWAVGHPESLWYKTTPRPTLTNAEATIAQANAQVLIHRSINKAQADQSRLVEITHGATLTNQQRLTY